MKGLLVLMLLLVSVVASPISEEDDVVFKDTGEEGTAAPTVVDIETSEPTYQTTRAMSLGGGKGRAVVRQALSSTVERFVAKVCILAQETFGVELCPEIIDGEDGDGRGFSKKFDD